MDRRKFLHDMGLGLVAGAATAGCRNGAAENDRRRPDEEPARKKDMDSAGAAFQDWAAVRNQFALRPDLIHMSMLFIASHPLPVRQAIEKYRREIDEDPVRALQDENSRRRTLAREAAARYLGAEPESIAFTESTTMGLGLVYNGLRLAPGQEILTTEHGYYVTHESLRLAALRTGASIRRIRLYREPENATVDGIVSALAKAIVPATRVLALTWVQSGTGLKLPLAEIGKVVEEANAGRAEGERVLLCVDGVHGFGVEDFGIARFGCDFFMAGCHKWLFGPRGTGLIWGSPRGWKSVLPTIPSFTDGEAWQAWRNGTDSGGGYGAESMAPGGFKAFEHQWALSEAFAFHEGIGRSRIAERTHALNRQLLEGLGKFPKVRLGTPRSEGLFSGIACFNLEGMDPFDAVARLLEKRIVATVTPYSERLVRLTPSIVNTPAEIDSALAAIRELT